MLSDKEVELFWSYIGSSVDRILLCLDGLDENDLNWRPLDNANSLYVLAIHTIGNIEENMLGVLCGQQVNRRREDEFKVHGTKIEPVKQRWHEVQQRIHSQLTHIDLDREYEHPRRGRITGRDVLIVVGRHAAEHTGQAELTRDLLFIARGRSLPDREY